MKKLRAKTLAKLSGRSGETLAEVLIALLIAALAMTMLAAAISSSAKMITKSKQKMEQYYSESDRMAEQSGDTTGKLSINLSQSGSAVYLLKNGQPLTAAFTVNDEIARTKVIAYWLSDAPASTEPPAGGDDTPGSGETPGDDTPGDDTPVDGGEGEG